MSNPETQNETALAVQTAPTAFLAPRNIAEALEAASVLAKSSLIPQSFQGKPADVLVALQYGAEVGLKPMASLRGIAVVNGKPGLYGDALLAVVQRSSLYAGHVETFDEQTQTATATFQRKGVETAFVATFSQADAEKAGLWRKAGPWTNYPKRMLALRARAFALRNGFADVLGGADMAEELMDYIPATVIPAAVEMPRRKSEAAPAPAPVLEAEVVTSEGPHGTTTASGPVAAAPVREPVNTPESANTPAEPTFTDDPGHDAPPAKDGSVFVIKSASLGAKGESKRGPWQVFNVFTLDGKKFGTFSETIYQKALALVGKAARITANEPNAKGNVEIVSLEAVGE